MRASFERCTKGSEGVRTDNGRARLETRHARSITTDRHGAIRCRGLAFGPTASREPTGGHFPSQQRTPLAFCWAKGWRGRRCVTPRQACPRPNGLGRNLRSKTRWFTGFCNSHQVSHFATFFIDARAEISVAESRFKFSQERSHEAVRAHTANGAATANVLFFRYMVPWRNSRRGFVVWPRAT